MDARGSLASAGLCHVQYRKDRHGVRRPRKEFFPSIGNLSETVFRIVGFFAADWIVVEHDLYCESVVSVDPERFFVLLRKLFVLILTDVRERFQILLQLLGVLFPFLVMRAIVFDVLFKILSEKRAPYRSTAAKTGAADADSVAMRAIILLLKTPT